MVELNKDICKRHLEVMEQASEQWFYGYDWEASDQLALSEAVEYFKNIQVVQRKKLIKEGKI